MKLQFTNVNQACLTMEPQYDSPVDEKGIDTQALTQLLLDEMRSQIQAIQATSLQVSNRFYEVANRMALEVERVCSKSARIQSSGEITSWQINLGRHRLQKCLAYYQLGSKRGRVELHSTLSAIVYRYITAPHQSQLTFQARYQVIEDFLQEFYVESLKAFRRENELGADYTPRTQLELAEYMAFSEQYAKRQINLPNGYSQQLIVLRAQAYTKRQPAEVSVDIEQAVEFAKSEEAEAYLRSPMMQQVRSQMVSSTIDPAEEVLRDRLVSELVQYLESQGQSECVDYLILKMQDFSAPEIDEILNLTSRQRDYLQQRFKYHVEKFTYNSHWEMVHQWLGADLDQKLGMTSQQWEKFLTQLSPEYQMMLQLKQAKTSDTDIAKALKWTPKQIQKRWSKILELAWKYRNSEVDSVR